MVRRCDFAFAFKNEIAIIHLYIKRTVTLLALRLMTAPFMVFETSFL